uniref:Cytochrome c oxidase subunit 7C, mitochondrial n=4 Tax=Pomacentridae TaxID=30863 RepID=A0A3B4YYZ7_9TELE
MNYISHSLTAISQSPLRRPTALSSRKVALCSVVLKQRRDQTAVMLGQAVRRFTTSAVRSSHYAEGPGKNLPFSVENKWRLLGMMVLFFGSGFAFPFIVVRHQILKK